MEQLRLTLPELEQEEQGIRENLGGIVKNFVRTGWHLSRIDRSGAYKLKGYSSITEYARETFGMTPDGVSRFIHVYEKYSIQGDTPELREEYRDFNFSQLTEMLQLPEEDYAMIRPETKREDIRDLKKFNKQSEHNPNNLLNWQQEPDDIIREAVKDFFFSRKKDLNGIYEQYGIGPYPEETVKLMARFLYHEKKRKFQSDRVFIMLYPDQVFIKSFDGELHDITWTEFFQTMGSIFDGSAAGKDTWENYFNPDPAGDFEEQIPGQDNIMNHPEYLPGKLHGRKFEHCIYLPEEDCISEDCGSCEKKKLLDRQEAKEQKNIEIIPKDRCITGQSGSGRCGAAYYCTEPVDCCAKCNDDCNSRCGWIEKPKSVDTETPEETCETVIAPAQTEVIPVEAIDAKDIKTENLSLDNLSIQINTDVWPGDLADIPIPSELFIREYLEEEEKTLRDYLECGGLPERTILRQQLKVAGLRIIQNLVKDILETEEEITQPELPRLKNNEERKEWLENYQDWGLWYRDERIDVNYYKYDFKDGSRLVAAEYPKREGYWNQEPRDEHFFHFLKKNKKKYASLDETYDEKFRNETDSITSLVEFLKEVQR